MWSALIEWRRGQGRHGTSRSALLWRLQLQTRTLSVSVDQSQRLAMEPLFGQAMAELSLISWNLAHRRSKLAAQVALIAQLAPDIACFQEVIQSTRGELSNSLRVAGLCHAADSFELAPDRSVLRGKRQFGEMIISRRPLQTLPPSRFRVPWPERVLSAIVTSPNGPIEVHTAHIPPGSTNG